MGSHTRFGDLSNEIFFEIFDYFDALDIFASFSLLNRRISSILQSISLRILTFHDQQVTSIKIYDTICDGSSKISVLFNRHNFINLKSCIFYAIDSSTRLDNVIKQIKNLHQLISFTLYQNNNNLNNDDTNNFTHTLLMHKSSFIRSVILQYPYNFFNISKSMSISSHLISLKLYISISPPTACNYTILSVLHLCHNIRYLCLLLQQSEENNTSK
ncbi:unnamed protein product [Adineta steineri]|nr:unnamed protein product [Adineta steineri]CAF4228044.1 unnamed protein product [Adineta steineri]CAF4243954.1 unnamed protein product [Adineta steineri]